MSKSEIWILANGRMLSEIAYKVWIYFSKSCSLPKGVDLKRGDGVS